MDTRTMAELLVRQGEQVRRTASELALAHAPRADRIPEGWNNNMRWHVGHLVLTPRRLVLQPLGIPLGVSGSYLKWFAGGTAPAAWSDEAVPSLEQLADEMIRTPADVLGRVGARLAERFEKPLEVRLATVRNGLEGLALSHVHDGIHLGCMMRLAKAL